MNWSQDRYPELLPLKNYKKHLLIPCWNSNIQDYYARTCIIQKWRTLQDMPTILYHGSSVYTSKCALYIIYLWNPVNIVITTQDLTNNCLNNFLNFISVQGLVQEQINKRWITDRDSCPMSLEY